MRRLTIAASCLALLAALLPAGARADLEVEKYALESASVSLSSSQAGAHADFTTNFRLTTDAEGVPYGATRDTVVVLPPGLTGNPKAFPLCTTLQFGSAPTNSECPQDAQIGSADFELTGFGVIQNEPVYNMPAPSDSVARIGFFAGPFPSIVDVRLDPRTNRLVASAEGLPSAAVFVASSLTLWGVPAHESHDVERLTPEEAQSNQPPPGGQRESTQPEIPFMTNPTSCGESREVSITVVGYQLPDRPSSLTVPFPQMTGCGSLSFNPAATLRPTTTQATSSTGLEFALDLPTKGLEFPNLNSASQLKRTEVILPEGMTLNPSAAEGLGVCSEADLARETYRSGPDAGCPQASKLGSVVAESPVIDRKAEGGLYLAKPYDNPFGSLLALYLVVKIPDRGVLVKVPGKVEPDPRTGQLVTTFDDIPQLPVSRIDLKFREGARAPLVTPPDCGTHMAISKLSPWSAPATAAERRSAFAIDSGPDRGPCPASGVPPFHPGFLAGSLNNLAGVFSPFQMRLTREDEDQDLTKFSATLPPGMLAKLAGTTRCPDTAIAQAKSRTGRGGGRLELASPSCPASSEIGRVLAGAGVGSVLTYVPGRVYLAGPYNGAPLSVVGIVPAVAGPFDVGTVVTRQALRVHPRTGHVTVDGDSSDPIPHILAGIPLKVRDIRVYVDRPQFTLNPTSCEPSAAEATLWGGGLDAFSSADDQPFGASSRFQAAECARLGFKPRLGLTLKGASARGGYPALRGVFRPRKGDANLSGLVLRLPRSAFLEQAHIRTICTRVQFAAGGGNGRGCPAGSVYGYARAWTPLLDEPLEGPVYLRSSNNKLPDFVAALRGLIDVEAVARIDSVGGGIRASFGKLPDAPIDRVVVSMRGGKKGLIVNSVNLCRGAGRAKAAYAAHNGRRAKGAPMVRAAGCRKRR